MTKKDKDKNEKKVMLSFGTDKCYICGRTVDAIKAQIFAGFNEEQLINDISSTTDKKCRELEDEKARAILSIISFLEGDLERIKNDLKTNKSLDLTFKTIQTDIDTFKGLIPNLDVYLRYERSPNDKLRSVAKFLEVSINKIRSTQDLSDIVKIYKNEADQVEKIQARITTVKNAAQSRKDEINVQKKQLQEVLAAFLTPQSFVQSIDGLHVGFSFAICAVCKENRDLGYKAATKNLNAAILQYVRGDKSYY